MWLGLNKQKHARRACDKVCSDRSHTQCRCHPSVNGIHKHANASRRWVAGVKHNNSLVSGLYKLTCMFLVYKRYATYAIIFALRPHTRA